MFKYAASAVLGIVGICSSLMAQGSDLETLTPNPFQLLGEVNADSALVLNRPDLFSLSNGSLLLHDLPVTTLIDGRRSLLGDDLRGMGAISPLASLPLPFVQSVRVEKNSTAPMYATDAAGGVVDYQLRRFTTGGEAGVFYGGSGGKYGREDFQAYIIGGAGSDSFQISAGAAYQNSSGHDVFFSH